MRLVVSFRFQPLGEISSPSSIPPPKRAYSYPVSSHRRARKACDLAAAGADGTGAMVKLHRADIDSWSGVGGSRGILGRTRDGVSQTPPTCRRLMGLGDKTATARRPELAGQPTARSVIPFVETVISNHTPGEGPALRPALHPTSQRKREGDRPCPPPYLLSGLRIATSGPPPQSDEPEGRNRTSWRSNIFSRCRV